MWSALYGDELDSWLYARAEAMELCRNQEETLLKKWLDMIGNPVDTIAYYRDFCNSTMEIYTTRPGVLIGRAGESVDKLKQMLSDEFRGEWKVKFIEIRGGFLNLNKK